MYKHVLLPTDGSELSGRATNAGIQLAKALGAKVTGFYAVPNYHPSIYSEVEIDAATRSRYEQSAKRMAETYLSVVAAFAKAMGVPYESANVMSDSPAEAIIQTAIAKGCDLIFMAPHGNSGPGGGLLGSTTNKVLANSTISVTVHR
jgi:nucleotide-binding universal stress UspA family protein